ncbi:MAG: pyridoxamine 5'-phosphate oxidase family protein [Mariprofundaceae bacterium]|nr:pyridoxamine 5'-phosphate oxidase family protein [Mariprofundaceae bacterium]
MSNNVALHIQQLLKKARVCFLATQGKHSIESSMAPYATHQGHILLHLSSLARHTQNIHHHPNIGLMICSPEAANESPLALPRLSFQGKVSAVPDERLAAAKHVYLETIPDAEPLFAFADFKLLRMTSAHIQWIGGFGLTKKISMQQWHNISDRGTIEKRLPPSQS